MIMRLLPRATSDSFSHTHTRTLAHVSGKYNKFYPQEGVFKCRACGAHLYSAGSKFDSGCGWPAFDRAFKGAVDTKVDTSHGMRRVEILCAKCGGHLGHVS